MGFEWRKLLDHVAPAIGTAIGGPFGAVAAAALRAVLGLADGTDEEAMARALEKATPEQLQQIREAEQKFKLDMQKLGVDVLKIDADDRDSARRREATLRDWIPGILAVLITAGFFGLLAWLMLQEPPAGSKEILNIMLGAMGAAWASVVSYYFGSSVGSAAKDKIIAGGK